MHNRIIPAEINTQRSTLSQARVVVVTPRPYMPLKNWNLGRYGSCVVIPLNYSSASPAREVLCKVCATVFAKSVLPSLQSPYYCLCKVRTIVFLITVLPCLQSPYYCLCKEKFWSEKVQYNLSYVPDHHHSACVFMHVHFKT